MDISLKWKGNSGTKRFIQLWYIFTHVARAVIMNQNPTAIQSLDADQYRVLLFECFYIEHGKEKKKKFDYPPRLSYVLRDRIKSLPKLPPFGNRMKGHIALSSKKAEISVEAARERAKLQKAKKLAKE